MADVGFILQTFLSLSIATSARYVLFNVVHRSCNCRCYTAYVDVNISNKSNGSRNVYRAFEIYYAKLFVKNYMLVVCFPMRGPGIEPRSNHVGFLVDNMTLGGRFSSNTSGSPANSHSTDCSTFIIIYHLRLV
jgi:hypothetical protein